MLVMLVIDHIIIMKTWHYKGFMRLRFQREKMSVGALDTLLPSERLFEVLQSPVKTSSRQFLIPYKYLLPHFSFNIAPFLFQYSLKTQENLCFSGGVWKRNIDPKWVNPLSANPTKWSNTQTISRQQPSNCLVCLTIFRGWRLKG